MPTTLHRPAPVDPRTAEPVDRHADPLWAADQLLAGRRLGVTDHYSTGAEILAALERRLPAPPYTAPYAVRQEHRQWLRRAGLNLIVPVRHHRLALPGSRAIPLLRDLYGELADFHLPLLQAQELHSAGQRYEQGVHLAVLGHRLHPFYGTYAPTRTEHLALFGTWLSAYDGARARAVDVGTGCGVLALMLAKAGFEHVLATDENPNAVESVRRELARLDPRPPVEPLDADLLGTDPGEVDLVVFNPPWVRGEAEGLLDRALVYRRGLFERFFTQALGALTPHGRIVLVFSNVQTLVQPDEPHPLEAELARGRLQLVEKLTRKMKGSKGPDGRRRTTRERVEIWVFAPA